MLFIAFAHTVSSMYRCKYHFEILTFHSFFFLSLRKASKNQYYCVYFTSELKLFLPALLQVIGKRCDGGGGGKEQQNIQRREETEEGWPDWPKLVNIDRTFSSTPKDLSLIVYWMLLVTIVSINLAQSIYRVIILLP